MSENAPIRVRIAPSPTGYLHLGTIRAALFNYLFAKKEGGVFVIRIEDTDTERSLPMYESDILEGFKALKIVWDEGPDIGGPYGPYRQSERLDIYKEYLQKMIDDKKAYWCFCTKEELENEKQAMMSAGLIPRYSGKCKSLTPEQIESKIKNGEEGVIRLSVPGGIEISFHDIIRGEISVNTDTIGDIVIARNLQSPLYNFAVVVDDYLMKISHVIRGEDHISNTPKQILIQKALGIEMPKYAHLPLVLSPDRSKMSKRKMETSFDEYLKDGYLPEAIINFLGLLGWHPEDDQEILSPKEMVSKFSLKRVQKAGGVFNVDKLDWFNAQYIKQLEIDDLVKRLESYVPQEWVLKKEIFKKAVIIERDRIKKLSEFKESAKFFFEVGDYDSSFLIWKDLSIETIKKNLEKIKSEVKKLSEDDFVSSKIIEEKLMPLAETLGRGESLWPLRISLSGLKNSPGPFEIMSVIGKKETIIRIEKALAK
ncbi:MAG TPA: glutamate--tRNA ligase [Candidatus Paceibacterota bacterium]|nr:glutamate--tRNA ligase [Candidatus Paceibacterota bacterium]